MEFPIPKGIPRVRELDAFWAWKGATCSLERVPTIGMKYTVQGWSIALERRARV